MMKEGAELESEQGSHLRFLFLHTESTDRWRRQALPAVTADDGSDDILSHCMPTTARALSCSRDRSHSQ